MGLDIPPGFPPAHMRAAARLTQPLRGRSRRRYPSAEELVARVTRRTGLSDFGPGSVIEPLDELLRPVGADPTVTALGLNVWPTILGRLLTGRLRIVEHMEQRPAIRDEQPVRPIIVTGMPRTGTTLYREIMGGDQRSAYLSDRLRPSDELTLELGLRYDEHTVTDDRNRLLGIVTLDDIIDVVKEEATEDFFKMVGTSDDELVYQDRSLRVARFRLPWLLINLVGLIGAGMLLKYFEVTLKEALVLVFFLPVVMGMGGNVGSQTATITVRGLATGRIADRRAVAEITRDRYHGSGHNAARGVGYGTVNISPRRL